jgi:hydrogenase expression/formation protein HypD
MKYIDEFREEGPVLKMAEAIQRSITHPWTLMEICGGQTHAILKYGLDGLLPPDLTLVHGPGCPVCVTPMEIIDRAVELSKTPGFIFCSFGDMVRVPGTVESLLSARASGGDVRIVYSPLDALKIAVENPDREVIFFAVGFETTAPANAMTVDQAFREGIQNFSLLVSQVLVAPAMEAILSSPQNRIQGFLAAGHVCTVMGYREYEPLASKYKIPVVVTGFEPLDILQGIYLSIRQLEEGRAEVENQYRRSAKRDGNLKAKELIQEIFEIVPRRWRGLGTISQSGLGLRPAYSRFDAERKFGPAKMGMGIEGECQSGAILLGLKKPPDCPAFGVRCLPESPLGAPMVSEEGACSAYYKYRNISSNRLKGSS